MRARAFLLAAGLLCGAAPLGAQGIEFRGPSGAGLSSPVATDPVSATGVWTFDNATNTRLTCSDGIATSAATTADAAADSLFGASATTKKALVIQAKATPTAAPFVVQQSTGTPWFSVETDGNVLIDQRTAATFTRMLKVSYLGVEQFSVGDGTIYARGGINGGAGFFTTDISGNATALANLSGRHLMSNGTSPTAPAGGGTCGTSAPSIAGKDSGFKLTVGSVAATSCTVTFGTAWATAPVCVANAATTTTGLNIVTGTSTVTISAAALTPAEVLHVVCVGF